MLSWENFSAKGKKSTKKKKPQQVKWGEKREYQKLLSVCSLITLVLKWWFRVQCSVLAPHPNSLVRWLVISNNTSRLRSAKHIHRPAFQLVRWTQWSNHFACEMAFSESGTKRVLLKMYNRMHSQRKIARLFGFYLSCSKEYYGKCDETGPIPPIHHKVWVGTCWG